MWRELSDTEWSDHPLNRARGWVVFIVWFYVFVIVVTPITLLISVQDALSGDIAGTVLYENRPFNLQAAETGYYAVGTLAVLWAIWTRWRYAPELYLVNVLVGVAIVFALDLLYPEPDLDLGWWRDALLVLVSLIEVPLAIYMLIGARPNVMFKRRVRAAP